MTWLERAEHDERHAAAARERGRIRLAEAYERSAAEFRRLDVMLKREEKVELEVARKRYRATLNYNDQGEWYGSARLAGRAFPAAYTAGHATREAAIEALKEALR